MDTKKWYLSKAIWGAIFIAIAGVAEAFGVVIPPTVYAIAAALGIYGIRVANGTKIG